MKNGFWWAAVACIAVIIIAAGHYGGKPDTVRTTDSKVASGNATKPDDTRLFLVKANQKESRDRSCSIELSLKNWSPMDVQDLTVSVVGHFDYGRRAVSNVSFQYIKKNREENGSTTFFEACSEKCSLEIQDVVFCRLEGKLYSDCIKYLDTSDLGAASCTVKKSHR